jgi:hypothetical protein
MTSPLLYLNTVRYLRPSQVSNRVSRNLFPLRRIPLLEGAHRLVRRNPVPGAIACPEAFDGKSFRFLNRQLPFEGADRWSPAGAQRLWVYHLHYFRYLEGLEPATGLRLIRGWIADNLDSRGPGWEPYPLTLRIREWIEWLQKNPDLGTEREEEIVTSVARQAAALESQIEYHLLGNHVLENAVTLCWAGLSLAGPESGGWLRAGSALLSKSLDEQILADGSHDERSPMYQAQLSESLLRLAEVAAQSLQPGARKVHDEARGSGLAMMTALGNLLHPDGDYALVNDTTFDGAPAFSKLCRRFLPPEEVPAAAMGGWSLPRAGYFGWRANGGGYLVFDAGPIGPDHQPGHGHADALSFELSWNGRRIFTDTGVMTYEPGPVRESDRGTAAHNTIQIDGRDQSELWSAFRCGRRTSIEEAAASNGAGGVRISGTYRGPGRSPGGVRHRRRLSLTEPAIGFEDDVTAGGQHEATLRLHVAPGLRVSGGGTTVGVLEGERAVCTVAAEGFDWTVGTSPYHPEFGVEIERPCLTAKMPFRDSLRLRWNLRMT